MTATDKKTFYAHGKLLLTGEYVVLHGAKALALPVKYGQWMTVSEGKEKNMMNWKAFSPEGLWFWCDLQLPDYAILESSDNEKALVMQEIFRTIGQLNPAFQPGTSLEIQTRIDFNRVWGLGSSSTLVANLAKWTGVDAFKLNELIFRGSGFDIACATADGPVFYQKNQVPEPVNLEYPFLDRLYFVYSGAKKGTCGEVARFLSEKVVHQNEVDQISQLSGQIARAKDLPEFQRLIAGHEKLVSGLLGIPTVKSTYFADFDGEVKSLGAWGGDFYLVASQLDKTAVRNYFSTKGLKTIFSWNELILNER